MKSIKDFYKEHETTIKGIAVIGGVGITMLVLRKTLKKKGTKFKLAGDDVAKEIVSLFNNNEVRDMLIVVEDLKGRILTCGGPELIKIVQKSKFQGV